MFGLTDAQVEMADKSLRDREKLHTMILHTLTDTSPRSSQFVDLKITLNTLEIGLEMHDGFNR